MGNEVRTNWPYRYRLHKLWLVNHSKTAIKWQKRYLLLYYFCIPCEHTKLTLRIKNTSVYSNFVVTFKKVPNSITLCLICQLASHLTYINTPSPSRNCHSLALFSDAPPPYWLMPFLIDPKHLKSLGWSFPQLFGNKSLSPPCFIDTIIMATFIYILMKTPEVFGSYLLYR